jgi:hypothetical protein
VAWLGTGEVLRQRREGPGKTQLQHWGSDAGPWRWGCGPALCPQLVQTGVGKRNQMSHFMVGTLGPGRQLLGLGLAIFQTEASLGPPPGWEGFPGPPVQVLQRHRSPQCTPRQKHQSQGRQKRRQAQNCGAGNKMRATMGCSRARARARALGCHCWCVDPNLPSSSLSQIRTPIHNSLFSQIPLQLWLSLCPILANKRQVEVCWRQGSTSGKARSHPQLAHLFYPSCI